MPLLHLVVILILVAVLVWAMNTYLAEFMDPRIRQIINIVIIIAIIVWLLGVFGVLDYTRGIRVGMLTP